MTEADNNTVVHEPMATYGLLSNDYMCLPRLRSLHNGKSIENKIKNIETGLKPIIKWAGGKEKELKYIIPYLPDSFDSYFEPFVGGGAVFTAITARHSFINDLSTELMTLYENIATQNSRFFEYIRQIDNTWSCATEFFKGHLILIDKYKEFRNELLSEDYLSQWLSKFCEAKRDEILSLLGKDLQGDDRALMMEMHRNILRKMKRMKQLEQEKRALPEKDLMDNAETAIKGAIYMYLRTLYNKKEIEIENPDLHCALFCFIRNYCYSGMFRYNDSGEFNVPYGGIAYNTKSLSKKLLYYKSEELVGRFNSVTMYNLDFEEFLHKSNPRPNDFVFLDPPYDSEFSTYAKNEFNKDDQRRLAHYLLTECKAKWMLVIKNTDFIYGLYNQKGINIRSFDKEYRVSFMNRNDKKTTHLLITNY